MREPFVKMSKEGSDIDLIAGFGDLFIGMTITDEAGVESDKMTLEIDDLDGCVDFPKVGDVMTVTGGYKGESATFTGKYEVNSVDLEGWPQRVIVNGTSASAKKKNKERKTEKHDKDTGVTNGKELVEKIARRNALELAADPAIAEVTIEFEAQSEESDMAFLTRFAQANGFNFTVKDGKAVINQAGEGKSASGNEMPPLAIEYAGNILSYKVSFKEKPKHGKVKAHWFNRKKVRKETVETDGDEDDENKVEFIFPQPFKNEDEAKKAIAAKSRELERDEASATFEIEGNPQCIAERHIDVRGLRSGVDGLWNPTRVEHRWSSSGYLTTLECETPTKKKAGAASNKAKPKKKKSTSGGKPSGDASGGITV